MVDPDLQRIIDEGHAFFVANEAAEGEAMLARVKRLRAPP
jgi:hypothetical protein